MVYVRHIIGKHLSFDGVSLILDDSKVALRVLVSVDKDEYAYLPDADSTLLSKIDPIRDKGLFKVNGKAYVVTAETIFDRTSKAYAHLWKTGNQFSFKYTQGKGIEIVFRNAATFFTQWFSPENVLHEGGEWIFDLYVGNEDVGPINTNRSLSTREGCLVITNSPTLGEEHLAETVMAGGASRWLVPEYTLSPDKTEVEPEGWVTYTFELRDYRTKQRLTDVSHSGYIIDAVDGYAPHKRFDVVNGVGQFKVKALCLEDGDTMRVKVSQKTFTSRAEAVVNVKATTT